MKTKTNEIGVWMLVPIVVLCMTTFAPATRASGKIAFTSDRDGNREIYIMNADGSDQQRLTNNLTIDDHPTWSPDGTTIAFLGERETGGFAIFRMNADGTKKQEITSVNETTFWWSMSWSPDGRQIAFNDGASLFIVSVGGRGRRLLTTGRQPDWSPDGSKILFGIEYGPFPQAALPLRTIQPDGTNLLLLSRETTEWWTYDVEARWSPTGEDIVFRVVDWANFDRLEVSSSDGTERSVIYDGNTAVGSWPANPDWSPDGTKVVFDLTWAGSPDREVFVKVEGGRKFQLTNTAGNNFNADWQP